VAATRFVLDHPLTGAGLGMNTLALNEVRGPAWTMVHNVYLEYAADLGLPGLALFLCLLLSCLKRARAARRRAQGLPELSALGAGIETALLGFAVAAFFYPVAYHFYFYYLAGLAVAAGSLCAAAPAPSPSERPS
jgi:O-antigen ligase